MLEKECLNPGFHTQFCAPPNCVYCGRQPRSACAVAELGIRSLQGFWGFRYMPPDDNIMDVELSVVIKRLRQDKALIRTFSPTRVLDQLERLVALIRSESLVAVTLGDIVLRGDHSHLRAVLARKEELDRGALLVIPPSFPDLGLTSHSLFALNSLRRVAKEIFIRTRSMSDQLFDSGLPPSPIGRRLGLESGHARVLANLVRVDRKTGLRQQLAELEQKLAEVKHVTDWFVFNELGVRALLDIADEVKSTVNELGKSVSLATATAGEALPRQDSFRFLVARNLRELLLGNHSRVCVAAFQRLGASMVCGASACRGVGHYSCRPCPEAKDQLIANFGRAELEDVSMDFSIDLPGALTGEQWESRVAALRGGLARFAPQVVRAMENFLAEWRAHLCEKNAKHVLHRTRCNQEISEYLGRVANPGSELHTMAAATSEFWETFQKELHDFIKESPKPTLAVNLAPAMGAIQELALVQTVTELSRSSGASGVWKLHTAAVERSAQAAAAAAQTALCLFLQRCWHSALSATRDLELLLFDSFIRKLNLTLRVFRQGLDVIAPVLIQSLGEDFNRQFDEDFSGIEAAAAASTQLRFTNSAGDNSDLQEVLLSARARLREAFARSGDSDVLDRIPKAYQTTRVEQGPAGVVRWALVCQFLLPLQ